MNTNDPSLKLAMARLLPELIEIIPYKENYLPWMRWKHRGNKYDDIQETEWLYVVHLVEQKLDKQEAYKYRTLVWEQVRDVDEYVEAHNYLCATFNQRARAICKVKGIELENKQ